MLYIDAGTQVKYLHHEIEDCDNYQNGSEAAKSLYEKVKKATIAQRVALLESLRL